MGSHNTVAVTSTEYTLVYDSIAEVVEFIGSIQSVGGVNCVGRIDSSLPDVDSSGFVISSQNPVDLVVASSLKLYVKGQSSDANVILIDTSAFGSGHPQPVTVLNPVPSATPMIDSTSTEFIMQFITTSGSVEVAYVDLTGAAYSPTFPIQTLEKKIANGTAVLNGGNVVSSTNPLPIAFTAATLTSRSNTITAGGTAQVLMNANSARKGWFLQNVSTGDLWVNRFGGTAASSQPNILVPSGALYETPSGGSSGNAVSIFGATTGQAFTAGEW